MDQPQKFFLCQKTDDKTSEKKNDFTDFVSQTSVSETWYYDVFEALIGYPPRGLNPSPSS